MMGTSHPTRQSHFPEDVIPQRHSRVKFKSGKSKIYNKSKREYCNFRRIIAYVGTRGGVMVKALRCKPAGSEFDSRCCQWNF